MTDGVTPSLETIVSDALNRFHDAVNAAGLPVSRDAIEVKLHPAPHERPKLPEEKMAVYAFFLGGVCLKCGKVGPNSNPRFNYQHYNPDSAGSTLAASLLGGDTIVPVEYADKDRVGQWMQAKLDRVSLLLPATLSPSILSYLEAFLHVVWNPRFEG